VSRDPNRDAAKRQIDAMTPPGWAQRFVQPPWPRDASGCRACGVSGESHGPWATCIIARRLERERVLLFTVAMCCKTCALDEAKRDELCERAFGAAN